MSRNKIVKLVDGEPEVQPTEDFKQIKDTSVVYLMKTKDSDKDHLWYKAQGFRDNNIEKFQWIALWNSVCLNGNSASLQDLIKKALEEGHEVIESNFSNFVKDKINW